MGTTWTIHPITDTNDDADGPLYAVMAGDGTGYVIGTIEQARELSPLLVGLVRNGYHDGKISDHDERLGWAWLGTAEAAAKYGAPTATVRWAAAHGRIGGAEKQSGRWRFPEIRFRHWLRKREERGRPRGW